MILPTAVRFEKVTLLCCTSYLSSVTNRTTFRLLLMTPPTTFGPFPSDVWSIIVLFTSDAKTLASLTLINRFFYSKCYQVLPLDKWQVKFEYATPISDFIGPMHKKGSSCSRFTVWKLPNGTIQKFNYQNYDGRIMEKFYYDQETKLFYYDEFKLCKKDGMKTTKKISVTRYKRVSIEELAATATSPYDLVYDGLETCTFEYFESYIDDVIADEDDTKYNAEYLLKKYKHVHIKLSEIFNNILIKKAAEIDTKEKFNELCEEKKD